MESLALELPPFGDGTVISCDGSAGQQNWFGASAAVAMSGRALVGWYEIPEGAPRTQYVELQALRLAVRLAAELPGATIVSDCMPALKEAQRLLDGKPPHPSTARWNSPDALAELAALLHGQRVTLEWEGPVRDSNEHVAAATPLGVAAHKLAITAYRLVRDGVDPPAGAAFMSWLAGTGTARKPRIKIAYENWRATGAFNLGSANHWARRAKDPGDEPVHADGRAEAKRRFSTTDVAAMAATTRHTVEREIGRGNLRAEKIGRTWVIEDAEAERWAAQFRPYAGLRKQRDGHGVAGGTSA